MTPLIRTTSQASIELAEAIRWYESKRRGLGGELLDEVAKTIEGVRRPLRVPQDREPP